MKVEGGGPNPFDALKGRLDLKSLASLGKKKVEEIKGAKNVDKDGKISMDEYHAGRKEDRKEDRKEAQEARIMG